jgi:hypothetical protein
VWAFGYCIDVFEEPGSSRSWRAWRRDFTLDDESRLVSMAPPVLWHSGPAEGTDVPATGYAFLSEEAARIGGFLVPAEAGKPMARKVKAARKRREKATEADAKLAAALEDERNGKGAAH